MAHKPQWWLRGIRAEGEVDFIHIGGCEIGAKSLLITGTTPGAVVPWCCGFRAERETHVNGGRSPCRRIEKGSDGVLDGLALGEAI